jgi:peptide-methionine (S)-S-oxide reductase
MIKLFGALAFFTGSTSAGFFPSAPLRLLVHTISRPSTAKPTPLLRAQLTTKDDPVAKTSSVSSQECAEYALFGMGCFWKPQEAFLATPGVLQATAGYANATQSTSVDQPSYLTVCNGDGHTEAVLVKYDPNVVAYCQLLRVFWQNHDASQISAKMQYQSVLWPLSPTQQATAQADAARAAEAYREQSLAPVRTIVVDRVVPTTNTFTPAESIHQRFWSKTAVKISIYLAATLIGVSNIKEREPILDSLIIKPILGLVAVWLLWEVVELAVSAARSFGWSPLRPIDEADRLNT